MRVDEPLELFPVCDVKVTGQMQLQHQDPGMFRTVVAGCCLYNITLFRETDFVQIFKILALHVRKQFHFVSCVFLVKNGKCNPSNLTKSKL